MQSNEQTTPPHPPAQPGWRSLPSASNIGGAALIVATAILAGHGLKEVLPRASLSLIFLVSVLVSAIRYGFWTGLFAAILAFLGYNFFFVEPLHTLTVSHPEDMLALAVFLLVATLTGLLAGRMREEANSASQRAYVLELLSAFSSDLSAATTVSEVEATLLRHLARASSGPAVTLKDANGKLRLATADPSGQTLDAADLLAADWAYRHGKSLAATAQGWPGSRFTFHPLKRDEAVIAVYGVATDNAERAGSSEREQAIEAMMKQGALAIERISFAQDAESAKAAAEQERLRSALLSSISHDLRTPLATILGSVTSLRQFGNDMPPEAHGDLLLAIEEETGRLSRFVANLLAMTRLEAGLEIKREWIDAADVANAAVKRARQSFPDAHVTLETGDATNLLHADAVLLEQALFNLVDNAIKFSPPGRPVRVSVSTRPESVEFAVLDEGRGIPKNDLDRVFEKFYRIEGKDAGGAGVGLAICRGIAVALGGKILAESPVKEGGGTRLRMILPTAGERSP